MIDEKKLKIAYLAFRDCGIERYLAMLTRKLSDEFDTTLITMSTYDRKNFPENIHWFAMDIPFNIAPLEDLKAAFRLRKILKENQIDILYCHSSTAGGVGRMATLFMKKCKVIYNPHGWSFDMKNIAPKRKKLYLLIEKVFAKFTKSIVAISDHEKNIALKNKICPESKIRVIKNGIDLSVDQDYDDVRSELGLSKEHFIVGCSARITDQKNPLLCADVMREVISQDPNARFVWVGDGDMRQEFIQRLKENQIEDKTVITGWTTTPHKYISAFDVGILLSKWEGFGFANVDYLCMGKPVVATYVGGIPEIIDSEDFGKCLKTEDPKILASAILSFKNCQGIEARARQAAKRFSSARMADETAALFREVFTGK